MSRKRPRRRAAATSAEEAASLTSVDDDEVMNIFLRASTCVEGRDYFTFNSYDDEYDDNDANDDNGDDGENDGDNDFRLCAPTLHTCPLSSKSTTHC